MSDLVASAAPPSPLARLRAAAGRLKERLQLAYEAELIAMLPEKVDGKPRRWQVAPPANTSILAPLLRPYMWQIAIPVTVAGIVGRWLRVGHPIHRNIAEAFVHELFVAIGLGFSLWFWSWAGKKLFHRHWQRMAIDAYNSYAWRRLRESDEVKRMVESGAVDVQPRRSRWPLRRLWRDP